MPQDLTQGTKTTQQWVFSHNHHSCRWCLLARKRTLTSTTEKKMIEGDKPSFQSSIIHLNMLLYSHAAGSSWPCFWNRVQNKYSCMIYYARGALERAQNPSSKKGLGGGGEGRQMQGTPNSSWKTHIRISIICAMLQLVLRNSPDCVVHPLHPISKPSSSGSSKPRFPRTFVCTSLCWKVKFSPIFPEWWWSECPLQGDSQLRAWTHRETHQARESAWARTFWFPRRPRLAWLREGQC